MKRRFQSIGIRRVFYIYAALLAVLMLLLSLALIRESERSLVNYTLLHVQKNSEVLQTSIDQAAVQIRAAFTVLRRSESFDAVLQATRYSHITYQVSKDYFDAISSKSGLPSGTSVSLSTGLLSTSPIFLPEELRELDSRMPSTHNATLITTQTPTIPIAEPDQLTFGFGYFSNGRSVGNVYISLWIPSLTAQLPQSQQEGLYFILADQWSNTIFLNGGAVPAELQESLREAVLRHGAGGQGASPFQGQRYVVQPVKMDSIGCTLYSVTDTAAARAPLRSIYLYTLSILLVLVAVALTGSRYLHRTVIKPLDRFGEYITGLREEGSVLERQPPALPPGGCTEIQSIKGEFFALLTSINRLSLEVQRQNEDLHQAELLRKDIEIEQLRSQINPHFLYNTLELIRSDAIDGRIDQVSSITAAMGKLYRYSIKGAPIVLLSEELAYAQAYLKIQQERFADRITVLYNISREARAVSVPKMILQPLVENAIVHGIEPSGGAGTLFIGASVEEGFLTISVRDNGAGIPAEKLEALRRQLAAHDRGSGYVGLTNVSSRLYLQYGDRCAFRISSLPGDGTSISLRIPTDFFAPQAQKTPDRHGPANSR